MGTGTRIYLSDTKFNNSALPQGDPFSIDGVIRNGFAGGFRPAESLSKTSDLSGRVGTAFSQGAPAFDNKSLIGSANSGVLTTIEETRDITMIVTCRALQNDNGVWGTGNSYYANACSTYADTRGADAAGGPRGIGPLLFSTKNSSTNLMELCVASEFSFYNKAAGEYGQTNLRSTFAVSDDDTLAGLSQDAAPWIWCSTVVSGNSFKVTSPTIGWADSRSYTEAQDFEIHNRLLAAKDTGVPNRVPIGTSMANFTWLGLNGRIAVAEVLIFNRGLSDDEIKIQYELSKAWLSTNRGIMV